MDRWTMKELGNLTDLEFAAAILMERRRKVTPYSPLGQKLDHARYTLLDLAAKEKAERQVIHLTDVIELLEKHRCRYVQLGANLIALYDNKYSNDRVHIEIGDDGKSVSYAGKIIGGLDELEKRL